MSDIYKLILLKQRSDDTIRMAPGFKVGRKVGKSRNIETRNGAPRLRPQTHPRRGPNGCDLHAYIVTD